MIKDHLKHERLNHLRWRRVFKKSRSIPKGFTLIELIIVVAVIIILASAGLFLYHKGLAYAKATVCETNLRAINKAIKLYATENNDALPASLGQLKLEHFEKGYAMAIKDAEWQAKFSFFLLKIDASDQAYAQFLTYENLRDFGVLKNAFHCPADGNGGASYGINSTLEGKKLSEVSDGIIIVADTDNYTFSTENQLAKRHTHKAIGITKADVIVNVTEENVVLIDGEEVAGVGTTDEEDDLITICHKQSNDSEKTMTKKNITKKTITVEKSQLFGHLGHGDTLGPCEGD
jgi:prepilin-type N-terminal cleavage/methylation domain-containing protein